MPNPRAQKQSSFSSAASGVSDAITQGLLPMLANTGRGAVAGTYGLLGDVLDMVGKNPGLPTSQNILDFIPAAGNAKAADTFSTLGQFLPAPGVTTAGRVAKTALNPKTYGKAFVEAQAPAVMSNVYLPTTPSSPNPLVGARYKYDQTGSFLVPEQKKIEDFKDSSLLSMPWDATSRGRNIKEVSDERLLDAVLTEGGPMHGMDTALNDQGAVIASNKDIASRLNNRAIEAQRQSLNNGGDGRAFQVVTSMGDGAENFSTMPTDVYLNFVKMRGDKTLNGELETNLRKIFNVVERSVNGEKINKKVYPFENWEGFTPQGMTQLRSNGEMRKAFAVEMAKKRNQIGYGYNDPDVRNAILDPNFKDLPTGYSGGLLLESNPSRGLLPSTHGTYDTAIGSKYGGSLPQMPIEVLMPKAYQAIYSEMFRKYPNKSPDSLRLATVGALQRRKEGFSEFVDNETIDSVNRYLEKQKTPGLLE